MASPPKDGGAAGANVSPPAAPRLKAAPETPVKLPKHVHPARRRPGKA
jgi:hypothetical protein